jgi:aspartate aminotransferase-like enzyme
MPGGIVPTVDDDGLLEYSVVYTDRAVNHMSKKFQKVMNDISSTLKRVYNAKSAIIVPGSGTYGMEAVVRQFAGGKRCMVIRNGFFSFRWTQIFDATGLPADSKVIKARRIPESDRKAEGPLPFAPPPLDEVLAEIAAYKPDMLFMPHVETSSGILVSDDYVQAVSAAVHAANPAAFVVLDAIASGGLWSDIESLGVDCLISAPQKGWCGPACCAFVLLNQRMRSHMDGTASNSFAIDLKKWCAIMELYEGGAHGYHATMPTDALTRVRDVMVEIEAYGLEKFRNNAIELGLATRAMLEAKGYVSVAAPGCQSPTVVVSFTSNPDLKSSKITTANGIQIAGGVPLQCDEGADFSSFRIGLFGLEKHQNIDRTVATLKDGFNAAGI